jgi:hypothetical protein
MHNRGPGANSLVGVYYFVFNSHMQNQPICIPAPPDRYGSQIVSLAIKGMTSTVWP